MGDGAVGFVASEAGASDGGRSAASVSSEAGSVVSVPIVSTIGCGGASSSNPGCSVAISDPAISAAATGPSISSPYSDPAMEGGKGILSSSGRSQALSSASADDDGELHSRDSKNTGTTVDANALRVSAHPSYQSSRI